MAKKEVKTDLWVWELLKDANLKLDAQGSEIYILLLKKFIFNIVDLIKF